ncbi:T9SS type A sorting domain-containing protein [Flavobacterium sp.]|uniref:T9SS type A sorting domain-containing protein n=1 Tax=Flavobacterium sp. TaxID=239 RepID=UPI003751F1D2
MKLKLQLTLLVIIGFISNIIAQVSSNEIVARKWISENRELNIQPFHTFKLSFTRKSLSGETLRFQQMVNDVPVFQSEIVINFNPENELVYSSNSYNKTIENISTTPTISKQNALNISKDYLKFTSEYEVAENNLFITKFNESTKLVYIVVTNPSNGNGSWQVIIDAISGNVIESKDVAVYHNKEDHPKKKKKKLEELKSTQTSAPLAFVNGTAMVYLSDPLSFATVAYGTTGYVDGNDANTTQLANARSSVTLPEIDLTAGVYKLKSSYAEIKDFEAPTFGLFTQATNNFSFTRDNNAFESVNVFYHLDLSLRYINQTLGILCKPLLNSGVLHFDPSGLSGDDNSHYIPSADRLAFGEGCVDDAEDADVIWHEFGHGIHDWLTNGNASSLIGEGNGDYWAQSYSRSLNQWTSSQPAYQYMFSWDGNNVCWTGRNTNYSGVYPASLVGSIHTDGQMWATALMQIYDVIGRTKTDKAFLEGLALTNSSTNQQNAAIAVRQAAINMNYPCADVKTITQKFTDRGYTLPTLLLSMASLPDQTVQADANNTYTLPSYLSIANPINGNCDATLLQSPISGTVLAPGTYTISITASSGTSSVNRNFTLIVNSNLTVNENSKDKIVIYPNPAKNQLTIKGEFDANESITVYNLLGQKIFQKAIPTNEEKIDVSSLSNGVYTLYFNNSKATYKFIKE